MWIGWCMSIGVCSWRYVELFPLPSFSSLSFPVARGTIWMDEGATRAELTRHS